MSRLETSAARSATQIDSNLHIYFGEECPSLSGEWVPFLFSFGFASGFLIGSQTPQSRNNFNTNKTEISNEKICFFSIIIIYFFSISGKIQIFQ
jgi:hypothetical protein